MAMMSLHEGLDALGRRTRNARLALIAYITLSLVDILALAGEAGGMIDLERADPTALDALGGITHLLYALVMIGTIVLVAMWIYRAHANLWAAGMSELKFTPRWALGWYFIPIATLFKPLEAMRELWAHSLGQDDSYVRQADPPLAAWWGAWIVGTIVSNVSMRLPIGGTVAATIDLIATGTLAAAGWFLLRIIVTVNSAQRSGTTVAHVFT